MKAETKARRAAQWAAYQAHLAEWRALDARSELGAAMRLATVRSHTAQPTAAPLVASVEVVQ